MQLEIANRTRRPLPGPLLRRCADLVSRRYRVRAETVSLVAVGERTMRRLNRQHRGKDKVTDVLSFPFGAGEAVWGEVIICPAQIRRQAAALNVPFREELAFIVIHGLLHLAGLEDETERGWQRMRREGARLCRAVMGT